MQGGWLFIAWMLVLFLFAAPLLILLSRHAKQSARWLGWLAASVLLMYLIDVWWLILPSLPIAARDWLWSVPLTMLASMAIVSALAPYAPRTSLDKDAQHA
jgi:hypothetical protein